MLSIKAKTPNQKKHSIRLSKNKKALSYRAGLFLIKDTTCQNCWSMLGTARQSSLEPSKPVLRTLLSSFVQNTP